MLNKEKLQKEFQKAYEALNENQRQAVDTIEGPVMVIAGPGTGKTQILACRIGKILQETDTLPKNILCLTYTEAGVVAMRKRLVQFIGPDAYRVNICTFHAFCNEIIQENLSLFDKTVLDPISELEKVALLKSLIDRFPENHPLKRYRGDVYFDIKGLDSLFNTIKKESWTPEFLLQKIEEYISDLPTRKDFIYKRKSGSNKAGDFQQNKYDEEVERMNKLRAAVNEFAPFQTLMKDKNRYDYNDMITWVIQAFENNKNLLARYQEQYLYFLVDEFQDTSGTQNKLIELLINYWEKPNVFVVGDDDQSIYRFQGANLENMLQFANTYKDDLQKIVLTDNYRSNQHILDASKVLIDFNKERLINQIPGLKKELIASGNEVKHSKVKPILKEYQTPRQEMIDITMQLKQQIEKKVPPSEIAVIYKENKYGEELAAYLRLSKIPYYTKRDVNILDDVLAKKLILLLKYIAAEHDYPFSGDEMLFEILHFDWYTITPIEIAKLSTEASATRFSKNPTSLRKLLSEKAAAIPTDLFTKTIGEGLKNASSLIEKLIADAPNLTLQNFFENTIRLSGILNSVLQSPDKHFQLQLLTGFFDFIKEETHRNPYLNLDSLVTLISLMQKEGIRLPLTQTSGNENGIALLTVHGAKGLEFSKVFFAGCNSGIWENKRVPNNGFKLPDTVFLSHAKSSNEEELRRLFYVALTRPKEHLIISYCKFRNDGKEMEPSLFIEEIQSGSLLEKQNIQLSDDVLSEYALLRFSENAAPEIEKIETSFLNSMLEKFVMNVSALNNYLNCPLEFYYKNLIRIPSAKNESLEFGSAIHHALEKLFSRMQESKKEEFPTTEVFIQDFEWWMHHHRESFNQEQFDRRMEYGKKVLTNYYKHYLGTFNKIVSTERRVNNIVVNNVLLKGRLDKMEFDGSYVNVVDYKTGNFENAKKKLQPPNSQNPNGGDYWRQAVFYKILIDNYNAKDWKVNSSEFDFIEPDTKNIFQKIKLVITPADITTVTEQIVSVWNKIQNRDFFIGCGSPDCHWCNFVKSNNLAIALHEINDEEDE